LYYIAPGVTQTAIDATQPINGQGPTLFLNTPVMENNALVFKKLHPVPSEIAQSLQLRGFAIYTPGSSSNTSQGHYTTYVRRDNTFYNTANLQNQVPLARALQLAERASFYYYA
jgi:hypothetical protein